MIGQLSLSLLLLSIIILIIIIICHYYNDDGKDKETRIPGNLIFFFQKVNEGKLIIINNHICQCMCVCFGK